MDATSRQIVLAASAAEKGREHAGTGLLDAPPPPSQQQQAAAAAAAGQKRRRTDAVPAAQQAAAAVSVPSSEAEADALIAKVMSGELWAKGK